MEQETVESLVKARVVGARLGMATSQLLIGAIGGDPLVLRGRKEVGHPV